MNYPNVQLFIDGKWRPAASGKTIPVLNPATEEPVGTVAHAGKADLDEALAAADKGFKAWRVVSAYERSKVMRKAADLIRERADAIATLMTMEQGKVLAEARLETMVAADIIEWFAEEGRRTYGRLIPARAPGVYQMVIKEPVGPVAAFTPWNFPINQVVKKMSAALAAGCSIIVKAPEETPASPAELIRAFADAGVPAGVINLVYGVPSEISEYLIPHPMIRKISFTGSTKVGKDLAALAGQHMKRATMELGGHAPVIVFDDADIESAAKIMVAAKYRNAGQVCISPDPLPGAGRRLRQVHQAVRRRRQSAQGRQRPRYRFQDGSARQRPSRHGDRKHGAGRRRQRCQGCDRRQPHRQQGLFLRAHRRHRRVEIGARDERGAVRPAGADFAVLEVRRCGGGSQPPAVWPGVLRLHQIRQDRNRDRRGRRSRHDVDQPASHWRCPRRRSAA